ncbi:leucine-rich repeat serine/threonine-protein kinase 1 isoform X1 [Hydra vulgaris]|uniref:leucine-rich repeat serine/threonine-protein kinase 1 isoform X1 n=1 Tax=Hydra vulgaris TaxID=6087 RepID=UPI001F5E6E7D|nr:leucine-rich repeat serine/threonine-protein kinase 1 isoform X1 [Hydra vulgaris]
MIQSLIPEDVNSKKSLTREDVNFIKSYSNNVMSMISFLDERGLGILHWTDDIGRTILHHIVDNSGNAACVKLLLEKNANPNAVSGIDDKCSTPLHYAAKTNNLACMITLLEYGAKIDIKNSMGKRAIDVATDYGSTDCINRLHAIYELREKEDELSKAKALYESIKINDFDGAKRALDNMKSTYTTVKEYSYDGNETLLNSACFYGNKAIVKLLLDNQADVRPNSGTGETPLYIACCNGHLDVVVLLAQTFPELLNLPCKKEQIYPLHAAIIHGKESIVEYLLTLRYVEHGLEKVFLNNSAPPKSNKFFVHINQPMGNGYTPIHLAVQYGNKNIISMLLACKPFIKITEKEEYPGRLILDSIVDTKTPLHFALQDVRNLEVVELLLKNGADLNASFIDNGLKYTPLQFVCKNENIEALKLLLKYNAEDHDGISLNEAMENNRDEVVNVLLSNGVYVNIERTVTLNDSQDSSTPVSIHWNKRFINILEEKWILAAPSAIYSFHDDLIKNKLHPQLITEVNLSDNKLEFVPFILFQLPALRKLNLSNNRLYDLCFTDSSENESHILNQNLVGPTLEELELQHNTLKTLPKFIFKMPLLQYINCSNNSLNSLPMEMWLSESLKVLLLDHNYLNELPILINSNRKYNIEQVDNEIDSRLLRFPVSKKKVLYSRKSNEDDGGYNKEKQKCAINSGLIHLDLSNNKFSDVPNGISCLAPNLFHLNLSYNNISEIKCISCFPKHLSHLALVKNNLIFINFSEKQQPNSFCYAYSEHIYTTSNNTCEHQQHNQLVDLVYLNLLGNKLKSISLFYSFSNKKELFCENLRTINISETLLKTLPDGLKDLKKLEALYFTQNSNISDSFDGLIEQVGLSRLCPKNVVASIKVGCERNSNVRSLQKAEELINKKSFPNIKLIVIGPKKFKKSSLVKQLQSEGIVRKETHLRHNWIKGYKLTTNTFATIGIDCSHWSYMYEKKWMNFITWECNFNKFHHVFMFQHAVYLLVWQFTNKIENEVELLKLWFQNIQAYAPDSAVIVVITNTDSKIFPSVSLEKLKKYFSSKSNIIDFVEIDQNKVQNIKSLRDLISKTAMNVRDTTNVIYEKGFSEFYLTVEKSVYVVADKMKIESDRKNDLSFYFDGKLFRSKMFELLHLQNFELQYGDEELDEAVQYLHHFGSILHFNVPALNDVYFFNPQWLCDILVFMMKIMSSHKNGYVKITDIKRNLVEERFLISKGIELLNSFDIAVKLSENELFVPSFLPVNELNPCKNNLQNEVYRRQYLMSFVPSGFWFKLIKRIRVDKNVFEALSKCFGLTTTTDLHSHNTASSENLDKIKIEDIINWSCWKTGIEVSCFGIRLLRICELPSKVAFYGSNSSSIAKNVSSSESSFVNNKTVVEIIVPVVYITIGKYESQVTASGTQGKSIAHNISNIKISSITDSNHLIACKILVSAVDCIDKLLSDWFSKFSSKDVKRVSFCNLCIQSAIEENNSQSSSFNLSLFEFEHALDCLKKKKDLICPFHENLVDIKKVFPDLCFLDFNCKTFSDEKIDCDKLISKGKFNDVFAVKIVSKNSSFCAAMKVPCNSVIKSKSPFTEMEAYISWNHEEKFESYMSYRNFREELAVILSLEHQHIVKFKGLSLKPLAMFFELVPRGSLNSYLDKFREWKTDLPVYAVQKTIQQVSDALNYLHSQSIICYDLKSDNILVHEFPEPDCSLYVEVRLLLAGYGNSKKLLNKNMEFCRVSLFRVQDEIENEKVLSFLFGSFVYELINLRKPFGNCDNRNLVNKFILEGKRPKISLVARQYPIPILSLLHRCWSYNDRPTTLEIKDLANLDELTSLLDVLELDKNFYLQCIKTCSSNFFKQSAVSTNDSIGSHVWLISTSKNQSAENTVVTIFSYEDFKYVHELNIQLKEKIITACLVGNTMWLGTDKSTFKVYCTSKYRLIAYGTCINHAFIVCMYYFALKKFVVCAQSDGNVLIYSDDVCSPSRISSSEPIDCLHPITNIVLLKPLNSFSLGNRIHCICAVESNASIKKMLPNDFYNSDTNMNTEKYELWCGQEKGCISILRASSLPSYKKIETLSAQGKNLSGFSNKIVTYLETNKTFESDYQNKDFSKNNSYVWMVVYPGTQVKRWNVDLRIVEGVFDAKNYSEVHKVNSVKPSKRLITEDCQAQIQSLVVVEDKMFVGTSFGVFFTCDAYTMIPYTWLRCYKECLSVVLPCRMLSKRDVSRKENLILTCGQKSLGRWLNNNDFDNNQTNAKRGVTLMTWNSNSFNYSVKT